MLNICLHVPADGPWSGQMVVCSLCGIQPELRRLWLHWEVNVKQWRRFVTADLLSDCVGTELFVGWCEMPDIFGVYCLHPYATSPGQDICSALWRVCNPHLIPPHAELSLLFASTGNSRQSQTLHLSLRGFHLLSTAAFRSEPCVASSLGWMVEWRNASQLRLETRGDKNLIEISEACLRITTQAKIKHLVSVEWNQFLPDSDGFYQALALAHLNIQVTGVEAQRQVLFADFLPDSPGSFRDRRPNETHC